MTIDEELQSLRTEMDVDETLHKETEREYYAKRRRDGDRLEELLDKKAGIVRKKRK